MERKTPGSLPGPSRRRNTGIDLINGMSGFAITGWGNGRSGAGADGVGTSRGSGRRGRTLWRGRGGTNGVGRRKEPGAMATAGGGGRSGRGGRGGKRGRGAFGRGGKGMGKGKTVWRKKPEPRDWAGMPWDALSLIFGKIGAPEVLCSAQAVCRQWWLLAHDPRVWISVDLRNACLHEYRDDPKQMAIEAVDRSAGRLEEFSISDFGDDEILLYMRGRADRLRCLRLISCGDVTSEALVNATKHFPLLEELEISFCYIDDSPIAVIGQNCPSLKCFRLNRRETVAFHVDEGNSAEATLIANNMPKLQELQLLGNRIGNTGVMTILDCCPLLESLDLRYCWNVTPDNNLKKSFEKIKNLKLPGQSLLGHPYYDEMDSYDYDDYSRFGYDEDDDYDIYGLDEIYPEFQYDDFLGLDHAIFSDDDELSLLIALGTLKNAMEDGTDDESD